MILAGRDDDDDRSLIMRAECSQKIASGDAREVVVEEDYVERTGYLGGFEPILGVLEDLDMIVVFK
jgi:hypothetical protein